MLKIGLTGGIGSGKTAASDHFARLGADVIDTDLLSRELVTPGQPALGEIVSAFGDRVLRDDGTLDRAHLRRLIFAEPALRQRLEAILHPRIRAAMLARAARSQAPYLVFVIPLLLETGQQELVDRVLLIDIPEALQRQRVMARDRIGEEDVARILRAQTSRAERLRQADDVIRNDGSLTALQAQVAELHRKYLLHSRL